MVPLLRRGLREKAIACGNLEPNEEGGNAGRGSRRELSPVLGQTPEQPPRSSQSPSCAQVTHNAGIINTPGIHQPLRLSD